MSEENLITLVFQGKTKKVKNFLITKNVKPNFKSYLKSMMMKWRIYHYFI